MMCVKNLMLSIHISITFTKRSNGYHIPQHTRDFQSCATQTSLPSFDEFAELLKCLSMQNFIVASYQD